MKRILIMTGVAELLMTSLTLKGESPDTLTFNTEPTAVLSTNANSPDTVFEGVSLDEYEAAYAYFDPGSSSGSKYHVCPDLHSEILRPYNVVRATENNAATMTVQFQGMTRTHRTPYTASITVKFIQSGDNVVAYVVRAASLRPLDIELGLDLDAMVSAGNTRALSRPTTSSGREAFNVSAITMRKPAETVSYMVHEGDSISDTLAGNGMVTVAHAAADEVGNTGYLPNNSWVVVAENHDLADLDQVEGSYHYGVNLALRQTAYNLKYTIKSDRFGQKTCQFQLGTANGVTGALVQFRQNGVNVEALTSQYRMYYSNFVDAPGCEDQVFVGMDFETIGTASGSVPLLRVRGTYGASDDVPQHGVKDLTLKFRSRPTVVRDGYLPNGNDSGVDSWTVIAENHALSDLVEAEAFYHNAANKGYCVLGVNLNISGTSGTVQFQDETSDNLFCIGLALRQSGGNIEGRTGRNVNWYMRKADHPEVVYGLDFYNYQQYTTAARNTYGSFGTSDSVASRGIKNLRLRFATGGVIYAAASTSEGGNGLMFRGDADALLSVKTTASAVFPTNGVITVNPYATLTLTGHVANSPWTQYRVMTNGTLSIKGTGQIAGSDQIDLVGGTLSIRESDAVDVDSGAYINYVTLMNGARITGRPARVLNYTPTANWIVAGVAPSYCESGIVITGADGDGSRTFSFNVIDVAEGSDFIFTGDIKDNHTFNTGASGYWNVHVIKDGDGTMEISGEVALPNEICVSNGVLRLAANDQFKVSRKRTEDGTNTKAEVWLAGGTLETAEETTNYIGTVVAKVKDAPLNLGNGSKLTLSSFSFDTGANLLVSDNLGKGATLRIEGLTPAQRSRIRCGADRLRVREDTNGNLEPYITGFQISIR